MNRRQTLAELGNVLQEAEKTGRPIERRLIRCSDDWTEWDGCTLDTRYVIYRVQPEPEPPTTPPSATPLAIRRNATDRDVVELCAKSRAGYAVFSVVPIWWLGGTGLSDRIRDGETVEVRLVERDD